ncbi:MAG: hypothetical protein H6747_16525 [Deltaproteobacteria bacterium]|nr:hypothetical protein [Deltaproteobacteria bacterium]
MNDRILSPKVLAAELQPLWQFDAPVHGDLRLFDIYAQGQSRLVIELVAGDDVVSVAVRPDPSGQGLDVYWIPPSDPRNGSALAGAVRALLAKAAQARWRMSERPELEPPDALVHRSTPAAFADDPDHAWLRVDGANYRRLYAVEPRPVRVADTGISVHYPAPANGHVPSSGRIYRVPQHFHRRRFREHFRRLGLCYDDGLPRTVPTAATFAAALPDAPLQPMLMRGRRGSVSGSFWIRTIARTGRLPVCLAPRWGVELQRVIRHVGPLSGIPVDVGMLVHDVSVHAIGFHAVDREQWADLMRLAASLAARSRRHAARVARYLEDPLTLAAWESWKAVEAPSAFAAHFGRRAAEFEAQMRESAENPAALASFVMPTRGSDQPRASGPKG